MQILCTKSERICLPLRAYILPIFVEGNHTGNANTKGGRNRNESKIYLVVICYIVLTLELGRRCI